MAGRVHFFTGMALAAAAIAAPVIAVVSTPAATPQAQPACLAWLGSRGDGKCISWSMSSGVDSQLNGVPITVNGATGESGTSNSSKIMGGR